MNVLVVNGPNLNLLGTREPEIYGTDTLADLERRWRRHGARLGIEVRTFHSNHEGAIIDHLQSEGARSDGIILNAGALSHTSYAIHDALGAIGTPTVEVHISNILEREPWRRTSVTAPAAVLTIVGRGPVGYLNALDHLWARATAPPEVLSYGEAPDQRFDLRTVDRPRGIVVLLHGGFWGDVWARDIMDPLAVRLGEEGWTTANVEYRRGPDAYADAVADVAGAIDAVVDAVAARGFEAVPVVLLGHSAGGYLAVREAGTRPATAVVALAPVLDLPGIAAARGDADPVARFLGGTADERPERWRDADVADVVPARMEIVHGVEDESVPHAHSVSYAERHGIALRSPQGASHMSLIDPSQDSFGNILAAVGSVTS